MCTIGITSHIIIIQTPSANQLFNVESWKKYHFRCWDRENHAKQILVGKLIKIG